MVDFLACLGTALTADSDLLEIVGVACVDCIAPIPQPVWTKCSACVICYAIVGVAADECAEKATHCD